MTRYDFSALFSEAWKRAMTQSNIVAGFHTTGVYPFSRDKIDVEEFSESDPGLFQSLFQSALV